MAVKSLASASSFANLTTLGSTSAPIKVPATAPDVVALAVVYWAGASSAAVAAFVVTFGGVAMTEVTFPDGEATFGGGDCTMRFYELTDVPTGAQTIEASLDTNLGTGVLSLVAGVYSGVASIDAGVSAVGAQGAASVVVPSATASKFFNAFACKPAGPGMEAGKLAVPLGLAVTPATTGGTLAAGAYTWTATAINAAGETTGSNQITKTTTGSTSSAVLACPAVSGAAGWRVYRTKAGVTALVTTINTGGALAFTDTGAAGTAVSVPVANTANVYNQTTRVSAPSTAALNPLLMGDADSAGTGTVNFATNAPVDSSDQWAGIGVGLIGQGATFDSAGAGVAGSGSTFTWGQHIDEDASCVLVAASITALPSGASLAAQVGSTAMTPLGLAGDYAYSTTKTVLSQQEFEIILFIFVFIWFETVATTTTVYSEVPSLFLFGLLSTTATPLPTGDQTITLSSSAAASLCANSVSYLNVSGFDVTVANGSYASSVSVPSTVPAARVVSAHAIKPQANTFTYESSANLAGAPLLTQVAASDLTQSKRAVVSTAAAEQILLLGDGPGAFNVTPTAVMKSNSNIPTNTPDWCARAVNLRPAVVKLDAVQTIVMPSGSAALTDYRSHQPSPLRTWQVPATIATPASYGLPGITWAQAVDSVLDYTLDWSAWLKNTGDVLVDAEFRPVGGQLIIVSQTFTDTATTGWITSGVIGTTVPVVVHATFLSGRQDDRTFALIITQT